MTTLDSALVAVHVQIISDGVQILARHRCEAVLVVGDQLRNVETGTKLDAHLSASLLVALCAPDAMNPFRRGAVLVSETKVLRAGVPLVRDHEFDWRAALARELGGVVVHVSADDGHVWLTDTHGNSVEVEPADLGARLSRRSTQRSPADGFSGP